MTPQTARKLLYTGSVIIGLLFQSACTTPAVQVLPTDTVISDTLTPVDTSTPTDTPTPEATSTSTPTKTITPTFTPDVTATQLPGITPPVDGKGNVAGLVLWNSQPVPQAAVWLCEDFKGACVGTYQYKTNTDPNGYYVFENVTPGEYLVAINSFSSGWFIFYFDSDGNREHDVSAGKDLILNPWSIWKIDLIPISPRYGKDLSETHPTFTWEPYPDAAYYEFSIYDQNFNIVLEDQRVDVSEFILEDATLVTCNYYWTVDAYNAEDVIISTLKAPSSTFMYFINHTVPGTC